jgi:hypothetical protein
MKETQHSTLPEEATAQYMHVHFFHISHEGVSTSMNQMSDTLS